MHAFIQEVPERRSYTCGWLPVSYTYYCSGAVRTKFDYVLLLYTGCEDWELKHVWPPVYCNEVHFWLGVTGGWYVACEWFSCDSAELDNYFGRSATWSATSSRMRMRVDGLASHLELHLLDVTFTVEEVAKSVCKLKGMKTPLVEMVSWL